MKDIKYFKQFDIKFATLGIGLHEFDLKIDNTFFSKHTNEEIKDADIDIKLSLNKKETMCLFNFSLQGKLVLICDLCLEDLEYVFHTKEELILKISNEVRQSEDENIVYIHSNEQIFNVEQFLYEIIYAQVPMRKAHQEMNQTCNQEMIHWIEMNSKEKIQHTDPRWEGLKDIKLENN
ncbi:MAG: DUF177 domain-containing protein [Bacteroidales bacterium]|nr:DUF177 domain-containing protein [Bacteroidales bacterium]